MNKCHRCGYEWSSRIESPKECPHCKSRKWNLGESGSAKPASKGAIGPDVSQQTPNGNPVSSPVHNVDAVATKTIPVPPDESKRILAEGQKRLEELRKQLKPVAPVMDRAFEKKP